MAHIHPRIISHLPDPNIPWKISPYLFDKLLSFDQSPLFKQVVVLPSDPEYEFIFQYFCANPPEGYGISKVYCIHNASQLTAFESELQIMDQEASKFPSQWEQEPRADERRTAFQIWKTASQYFSPLKLITTKRANPLTSATVLPLWHGSSSGKSASICSTGFTYFGKHHFFHNQAQKGNISSTDQGYFGSGIYFTSSAKYAAQYADGNLLLAWTSMRPPYPVICDVLPGSGSHMKCTDMQILEGKGAYQTYNAHYIPVASIDPHNPNCMIYHPCYEEQVPDCDEIVVFSRSQTLPRFWVQISLATPAPPLADYNPTALHTAADQGELQILQQWIQEDKKRLYETSSKGETLWQTAIRGNCLAILQWLHKQDPSMLQKYDQGGSSLMHLACALGHLSIAQWIMRQDIAILKCINKDQWTPLHLAAFHEHLHLLEAFFNHLPADLLLKLAPRPCSKVLSYLLDKDITLPVNAFTQTLLHLATQAAQEDNIVVLLKHGFDLEARDLQGRTPLFLAVTQGHRSTVQLLLSRGAQLDTRSNEQETVLHIAAFYGYAQLLSDFIQDPAGYKLIMAQDSDGKTPLHQAVWSSSKTVIVKMLLEEGADPNVLSKYEYTPLHWAAKHGHIESARLLLQKGAHLDTPNHNKDTPLDLALHYHQDDIVHLFLNSSERLPLETPPSKDYEAFYSRRLLEAKRANFIEEQVVYLLKLSNHYLDLSQNQHKNLISQHNSLLKAAQLLNAALSIVKKSSLSILSKESLENFLFRRLEKVERHFIEFHGIKPSEKYHSLQAYSTHLTTARKRCQHSEDNPREAASSLTHAFKHLLAHLIDEAQKIFAPAPTQWAAICMGSMARDEMCPYSDVEFAFLVEKKTPEVLNHFRRISKFLQLQIINLGETSFPIFGEEEPSPTCNGFCLDTGGNTPLGVEGWYELIKTPKELAAFQSKQWMDENIILMNTLNCVGYLTGNEKLVLEYEKEREKALEQTVSRTGIFQSEKLRTTLTLKLLKGHTNEFAPDLSKEKEELKAFGIKKELYRPIQETLSCLAIFYGLKEKNSFDKIDALVKLGIFSKEGGNNITKALRTVLALRLQAHLFYQTEQEFLFQPEIDQPKNPAQLYLDEKMTETLQEIYRVIIPFHKCAKNFLESKKKKCLRAVFTMTVQKRKEKGMRRPFNIKKQ